MFTNNTLSVAVRGEPELYDAHAGSNVAFVHASQETPPPRALLRRVMAFRAAGCHVVVILASEGRAYEWWCDHAQPRALRDLAA